MSPSSQKWRASFSLTKRSVPWSLPLPIKPPFCCCSCSFKRIKRKKGVFLGIEIQCVLFALWILWSKETCTLFSYTSLSYIHSYLGLILGLLTWTNMANLSYQLTCGCHLLHCTVVVTECSKLSLVFIISMACNPLNDNMFTLLSNRMLAKFTIDIPVTAWLPCCLLTICSI